MSIRIQRLVFVVLIAAFAIDGGACARKSEPDEEAAPHEAKVVRCAPVAHAQRHETVELRGTVAPLPDKDAQIAPQVAGRLTKLSVREGDVVKAGQELARVDEATLADEARRSAAQVARAQAETALALTTETRVRRIFDRGIAARQELDDASARAATARAAEADARAADEIAKRQLARAQVRSPLAGVVLKILRRPGELVDGTPATPVVEVGDPTHLELVATATAAALVRVRVGDDARIAVPALPGAVFLGKTAAVSPAVDRATGLGVVRVTLTAAPNVPLPPVGVEGSVAIAGAREHAAWLVPSAALRAPSGHEAEIVLCGADGHAHVARVVTGTVNNGQNEIIAPDGADAAAAGWTTTGSAVVIDPVLGVNDGDRIERQP